MPPHAGAAIAEVLAAELEVAGAVDRRPMTASAPLALMLDFENSS
jgi:hypothetical protein